MKNRAKCILCKDIVESFHRTDYSQCRCGQISVYGGPDLMQCAAVNWNNFLRVDDLGNEVAVKIKDEEINNPFENKSRIKTDILNTVEEMIKNVDDLGNEILVKVKDKENPKPLKAISSTKKDLLNTVEEMIKHIQSLPSHAMNAPITHYDYLSVLVLVFNLFKSDLPEN